MTVCEGWADEYAYRSDYSRDWFVEADDPAVIMNNDETWAGSEFAAHGFTCAITGGNFPLDERHRDYREISKHVEPEALRIWLEPSPIPNAEQLELAA